MISNHDQKPSHLLPKFIQLHDGFKKLVCLASIIPSVAPCSASLNELAN